MNDLFLILALLSIVAFFVGLVKPSVFTRFLKKRATRKGAATIFGTAAIVFFVLFGITTEPSSPTQPATKPEKVEELTEEEMIIEESITEEKIEEAMEEEPATIEEPIEEEKEPAKPLSEKEQIQKLVSDQLKGTNNMKNPYVKKIDVIEQVDGGWGVFVEYNADDNLTKNLRKIGIEKRMSEIYIALYTSDKDIRSASVAAYFPLVDQYGNEFSGVVYKSILEKGEADKVNWGSDSSTLKLSILPGVWTTSILHPEFR